MAISLPFAKQWCIGGDFNMLEDRIDRIGGNDSTVRGVELATWERLCMSLQTSNVWLHPCASPSPILIGELEGSTFHGFTSSKCMTYCMTRVDM